MTKNDYQAKVDSIVGNTLTLLNSYDLPPDAIQAVRKSLFCQLDYQFGDEVIDER